MKKRKRPFRTRPMLNLARRKEVLELLASGRPLHEVLDALMQYIQQTKGMHCSILLLDEDGKHVKHGSAPTLPDFYNKAIHGQPIGPRAGSCGTSAFLKKAVVVRDILKSPLWNDYRDLAIRAKLRACWSTPIFSKDGTVLGTFAIYYEQPRTPRPREKQLIKDATGLATVILDYFRTQDKLKEAIHIRDEFISIASHELKTPLTSLILQIGLLDHLVKREIFPDPSKEKIQRCFTLAKQDLARFKSLIDDLLDTTRMSEKKLDLRIEKVNLNELISRVVERYKIEANQNSQIQLQLGDSVTGYWDPFRIDQVIVNILNNALKYGAGAPIEISTKGTPSTASISIRDHGRGIKLEDQSRIFERFEQASIHDRPSGLGLGLFIVRQIVEAHGGTIQVESKPGEGARFTVTLPRNKPR